MIPKPLVQEGRKMIGKRLVVGSLSVLLLALDAPAGRAQDAYVEVDQEAIAFWIFVERGGGTLYVAGGVRLTHPVLGTQVFGFVAKGSCERDGPFFSCEAGGRVHPIASEAFSFDPLLRSASLDLNTKGFTHHVEWVGSGPAPGATWSVGGGPTPRSGRRFSPAQG